MTNRDALEAQLPKSSYMLLVGAALLTGLLLISAIVLATGDFDGFQRPTKLSEWGDFAAGAFAPLAFLWLTVAVVLQSSELREQRKELQLTRLEFEFTRAVLAAQANEAKKQAEFIEKQTNILAKQYVTERRAEYVREFDDLIEELPTAINVLLMDVYLVYRMTPDGWANLPRLSEIAAGRTPMATVMWVVKLWTTESNTRDYRLALDPTKRGSVRTVHQMVDRAIELDRLLQWRRASEALRLELVPLKVALEWLLELDDTYTFGG